MASNSSTYEYLSKKYAELNLTPNKKGTWDPLIYPDTGYIPPCEVCKTVYTEYVNAGREEAELLWPHIACGCLWSSYYEEKLRQLQPKIRLTKKGKK